MNEILLLIERAFPETAIENEASYTWLLPVTVATTRDAGVDFHPCDELETRNDLNIKL